MKMIFVAVFVYAFAGALTVHAGECIDSDGDGWGWDGVASCRIGQLSAGECIDADGDGWGWNGVDNCAIGERVGGACIDTDGDGWGWDGVKSCKINDEGTMMDDERELSDPVGPNVGARPLGLQFETGHPFGRRFATTLSSASDLRILLQRTDRDPTQIEYDISRYNFEDMQVLFVGAELNFYTSSMGFDSATDQGDHIVVHIDMYEAREVSGTTAEDPIPRFNALLIGLPIKPIVLRETIFFSTIGTATSGN